MTPEIEKEARRFGVLLSSEIVKMMGVDKDETLGLSLVLASLAVQVGKLLSLFPIQQRREILNTFLFQVERSSSALGGSLGRAEIEAIMKGEKGSAGK